MTVPQRKSRPTTVPGLQWLITDDGSLTLWDSCLDETYHSGCGAVAESLVVYLLHSGLLANLQQRQASRIFELGFGTGTAFLLTAALAEQFQTPVEFWAIENRPLPYEILAGLQLDRHLQQAVHMNQAKWRSVQLDSSSFAALPGVLDQLLAKWPEVQTRTPGDSNVGEPFSLQVGRYCQLHLLIMDARQLTDHCHHLGLTGSFDAVFFDAFSPETSPELWEADVLIQMYELLKSGGTFTSYCVKSHIRKRLNQIGFTVDRLPGPIGGKREVLMARRSRG